MRNLLLLVMLSTLSVAAQAPASKSAPVELDGSQQRPHPLAPLELIRASDGPARAMQPRELIENNFLSVELSVLINLNGRVESAKPIRGPERFYEQAQEIEMHRSFEPVRNKDSDIVRAHFTDAVQIVPLERWSDHPTPLPPTIDRASFHIMLQRTRCFGTCPVYQLSVSGTGQVLWEGGSYFVAVPGTHQAVLPPKSIDELVEHVRAARVFEARDVYHGGWTDNPTYILTIDVNGHHKQIVDYIGLIVGMPTSIRDLENTIDRLAATSKWITGNADLLPSLRAEHWDFAASKPDNLRLYNNALQDQNRDLLAAFTAAHAPVLSSDPEIASPICTASAKGDSSTVEQMMASIPIARSIQQPTLDQCLVAAAQAGSLQLTDVWLEHGASVTASPSVRRKNGLPLTQSTPLLAAIRSHSFAVVRRLLEAHAPLDASHNDGHNLVTVAVSSVQSNNLADVQAILQALLLAGANPNEATDQEPSLFATLSDPSLVTMLVAAGANANAVDRNGMTPLMTNVYVPVLQALLKAGADPSLRNRQGQTAAEAFRAEGLTEQAALIDGAIKSRPDGMPASKH